MQFQIPLFIERKTKIVGPLTFRQFLLIGGAVGIIVLLYFTLGKVNFFLFLILSIVIFGAGSAFAFVNVAGKSLLNVFANFLVFLFASRIYLWKKKRAPIKFTKLEKKPKPKIKETPTLKIAEHSQLKKLSAQIETKTK